MDRLFYKTKITKVIDDYNYIAGILNEKKEILEYVKDKIIDKDLEYFENNGREVSVYNFIKEEEKNVSIIEKVLDI